MRSIVSLLILATAAPVFAQPNFMVPKAIVPDEATLKLIDAKRAELTKALAELPKSTPDDVRIDVEIYAKAAEWITRHGEWYTKDSGKQTLTVLDAGLARAKAAAEGKTPWRAIRNKPVIRAYRSTVDGSIQPYSVTLPNDYGEKARIFRLDVVLHGRDGTLTEVKFLAQREAAKAAAKPVESIILEPYGRGNNAYRWAGESDVTEGMIAVGTQPELAVDPRRIVLRGFSMGGAGTWHIGLHRPSEFAVIGPGAGFSTTRGYIKNFPPQPDYIEKCLHIYDAVDYAENAFNMPVVAYSGSKDPQKAAADNIENALKGFSLPLRFTHLIAPGLEHQMPAEWQAKAQAEYEKYVLPGRTRFPNHVRFVTYTTRYPGADGVKVLALDEHYRKAIIDAKWNSDGTLTVSTENVRVLELRTRPNQAFPKTVTIDGQSLDTSTQTNTVDKYRIFAKTNGKWAFDPDGVRYTLSRNKLGKRPGLQGPIDDAFQAPFTVVGTGGDGYPAAAQSRFMAEWDKFLRGKLPQSEAPVPGKHLVLFGTPQTNPLINEILPKLPITWTSEKLVVNGVEYDAKTHVPALIYPNPLSPSHYVVINSGHTFHAADFQGTNALLYPRLGDWAVLKPTPTPKDPAAAEVVAAGLFDEFWQFSGASQNRR